MKLYYLPGACSQAPHIALREIGARFDLIKVDRATKKTATGQDYLRISPNGYVPALELDNGDVLTEASVVLQYVADLAPKAGLIPPCGAFERYRLQMWLNFVSTEIHKGYAPLWTDDAPDSYKKTVKEKLGKRFGYLDEQFREREYLMGRQFTVADIYLFVVTGWAGHFQIDLKQWPALAAWRERIGGRASVKAALEAEG